MSGVLNLLLAGAASAIKDAYFNLTTLLLNTSSTNGAQNNTFLDSSTNNFTITRNGNTTQGTFTPFSQTGWSNYFDGASYLTPSSSPMALGSGAYTVEFWINPTVLAAGSYHVLAANATNGFVVVINNAKLSINKFGVGDVLAYNTALTLNTWTHVALVRTGTGTNQTQIYVNGTSVATGTDSNNWTVTTSTAIGANSSGTPSQYVSGYLSNLRICGVAVYTNAFTPSTTPLTTTSQGASSCTFLTCQDNRFKDNGSTAATFTTGGTPSVQAFSPFLPTAAYDTAVVGGSGYFDGSGDYLSVSQTAGNFGTSNFSIECYYCNSVAYSGTVYPRIVSKSIVTSAPTGAWGFGTRNGTTNEVYFSYYNGTGFTTVGTGFNVNDFAWHHLVVTYNGTTIRVFVDGVLRANAAPTISSFGTATGDPVQIGYQSRDTNYINGYVSGLRIANGSIPTSYQTASTTNGTSIFTPPTAPPTTSSQGAANVSLLTNFTNAGIIDSASKNVLETVGNAQVSTTQAKWGTTSMYFDGTGDYLVSNSGTDLYAFGSGNFTIEFWVYFNTVASQVVYDGRPSGVQTTQPAIYMSGAGVLFYYANGANVITGDTLTNNQWYHIAVSRSGTSTKMFLNGVQTGSTYTDSTVYTNTAGRPIIGVDGFSVGTNPLNGYIDDLRVTKGYARYTTTFTPPTAAFPLQ